MPCDIITGQHQATAAQQHLTDERLFLSQFMTHAESDCCYLLGCDQHALGFNSILAS